MQVMAKVRPVEQTVARLVLYRFLAQSFNYPQADLVDVLTAERVWDELLATDEALDLNAGRCLEEMRDWLHGYVDDGERLLLDLQIEHTHLFITARPHVPAPPYESAYRDGGLLMGESVSQVLEAYRRAGLAMHRDYDALPDHVAAELEFVSYLVQKEAEVLDLSDQAGVATWQDSQRRFLEAHLLRWGPALLDRIVTAARLPFYHLLATLAGAFFSTERHLFVLTNAHRAGNEEENHG